MPARLCQPVQQLAQCQAFTFHQSNNEFRPAPRRLDSIRVRKILNAQRCIEVQMRKVIPTKASGQPFAPDFRVRQGIQLAGQSLGLGLRRADHRRQPRQHHNLIRCTTFRQCPRLDVGIKGSRRPALHLRGEYRLGMARRERTAGLG